MTAPGGRDGLVRHLRYARRLEREIVHGRPRQRLVADRPCPDEMHLREDLDLLTEVPFGDLGAGPDGYVALIVVQGRDDPAERGDGVGKGTSMRAVVLRDRKDIHPYLD
jgi:hypothetical protein